MFIFICTCMNICVLCLCLGMKVTYDVSRAVGHRVVDVQMLCTACEVPVYEGLILNKVYSILLSTFIIDGGDGYRMIGDNIIKRISFGKGMHEYKAIYCVKGLEPEGTQ